MHSHQKPALPVKQKPNIKFRINRHLQVCLLPPLFCLHSLEFIACIHWSSLSAACIFENLRLLSMNMRLLDIKYIAHNPSEDRLARAIYVYCIYYMFCREIIKFKVINGAGGPSEHNFWTSRVNPIKNYIFGILRLRAIN